jgi:hypothetical protein
MPIRIAAVVEGQGDNETLPLLIRRFGLEFCNPPVYISTPRPVRVTKSKLLKPGELERAVTLAAYSVAQPSGVLIVLDADDDCPAMLGPAMKARAEAVSAGRFEVSAVVAKTEFEAWFIAAAESLAGQRGLALDLAAPIDPESIQDAKGWLSDRMAGSARYSEVLDQPALASEMHMPTARQRSNSFDKFCRELTRLIGVLTPLNG